MKVRLVWKHLASVTRKLHGVAEIETVEVTLGSEAIEASKFLLRCVGRQVIPFGQVFGKHRFGPRSVMFIGVAN